MARAGIAMAAACALLLVSCDGSGEGTGGYGEGTGAGGARAVLTEERLRDAIGRGVGEDIRAGTGAGPRGFGLCLRLGLDRALERSELRRLLAISRLPDGLPFAAQALNELAVPVGDACGGRRYVPKLTAAAAKLRGVRLRDTGAHRIGLEYGPYVGVACRPREGKSCDRVGVDLVLRRDADAVEATIGGRRLDLITPGPVPHAASAVGRDWGGYLDDVGLERRGSAFRIPTRNRAARHWAGAPPVYLPISVAATYSGGSREVLDLPPVFLSPGFG